MAAKKASPKRAAKAATPGKKVGLTAEERAAMKEYVAEMKAGKNDESSVLAKISAMQGKDKAIAKRIHEIIRANAPGLAPRTWYGMPAYAKDDKVVCFFQDAKKFKARYATLGFNDKAALDDGNMWPTSYALMELTPAEEAKVIALVKKAVS
jgi:uncharacterized protein YdhG (YjbR/CyaY superfamily)